MSAACIVSSGSAEWRQFGHSSSDVEHPVKHQLVCTAGQTALMYNGCTCEYLVSLRAVKTSDFMTADSAELPDALLKKVSSRIINEVRGINRVACDVSSKPPATIERE